MTYPTTKTAGNLETNSSILNARMDLFPTVFSSYNMSPA